jgi:hypothetical protein
MAVITERAQRKFAQQLFPRMSSLGSQFVRLSVRNTCSLPLANSERKKPCVGRFRTQRKYLPNKEFHWKWQEKLLPLLCERWMRWKINANRSLSTIKTILGKQFKAENKHEIRGNDRVWKSSRF